MGVGHTGDGGIAGREWGHRKWPKNTEGGGGSEEQEGDRQAPGWGGGKRQTEKVLQVASFART